MRILLEFCKSCDCCNLGIGLLFASNRKLNAHVQHVKYFSLRIQTILNQD